MEYFTRGDSEPMPTDSASPRSGHQALWLSMALGVAAVLCWNWYSWLQLKCILSQLFLVCLSSGVRVSCIPASQVTKAHVKKCLADLSSIAEHFSESFDWQCVKPFQLLNHIPRGRLCTSGKILAHALRQITAFREAVGVRVCVFKIGISANPVQRFVSYLRLGFTTMWVISKSQSVCEIHMLEAACISHFSQHVGCRNQSETGGEGALNRAHSQPPYFLYVTGARADQSRRIGWKISSNKSVLEV